LNLDNSVVQKSWGRKCVRNSFRGGRGMADKHLLWKGEAETQGRSKRAKPSEKKKNTAKEKISLLKRRG